jgi:hypothetical protein
MGYYIFSQVLNELSCTPALMNSWLSGPIASSTGYSAALVERNESGVANWECRKGMKPLRIH